MAELSAAIPVVREAVAAVMRVRMTTPEKVKHGKLRPARFQVALGGTGFCVVADRYLVTAFHVLNGGQPRLQDDQFSAFVVPANGDHAFRFPVVGYPLEDEHADLAVLELGPCDAPGCILSLPANQIT